MRSTFIDLSFYGLREQPFNPTPDPRFLHLTPAHQEALAQLLYGVEAQKGFILLTGEVGTGKTTLLQTLLERLDETTSAVFITNPMPGFEDILEYMLEDLGIAKLGESHAQRLVALRNLLIERSRAGQNTILILDEAQGLDPRTLEQIRLLSNFETKTEKTLQILLVGQPELRAKLDLPQLRQLKQRIGLRCQIPPLAPGQVRDYIHNRLRVAGAQDLALFSTGAIARIAQYSGGIPRIVNTVCDHCLLFGYADQTRRIDRERVDEAIDYLEEGGRPRRKGWLSGRRRWAVVSASAAVTGLAGVALTHQAMLGQALDFFASALSNFARAARAVLPL